MAGNSLIGAAVFVDRDDTLCPDVPHNGDPQKMQVYDFVPQAIRRLNDAGLPIIVVTNQSGIGRGMYGVEDMNQVNDEMKRQIAMAGGRIDAIYFCPHHPDDDCSCRKPKTGMGEQAIEDFDLDPQKCWMVGDQDSDIEFGKRLGMKTIRISDQFTFADATEAILKEINTL